MTTCATWCGGSVENVPLETYCYVRGTRAYDALTCSDAGKPLHPVSKPPGEPVPEVLKRRTPEELAAMPRLTEAAIKEAVEKGERDRRIALAAPRSALPLPGPPACEHMGQSVICPFCRQRVLMCPASERDEARTALAEERDIARRYARQLEDRACDIADLTRRLAVTVGALERIATEECEWAGGYENCAEAAANPNQDDFDGPCPGCIARTAIAPTGAPTAREPA